MSARDLKQTALELITELRQSIFVKPEEQGDMALMEIGIKMIGDEDILTNAITYTLPWKNKVKERDDKFFLDNKHLFEGLPDDKVKYYGQIICNEIDQEDKDVIWQYIDTIVSIAEKHKKMD